MDHRLRLTLEGPEEGEHRRRTQFVEIDVLLDEEASRNIARAVMGMLASPPSLILPGVMADPDAEAARARFERPVS